VRIVIPVRSWSALVTVFVSAGAIACYVGNRSGTSEQPAAAVSAADNAVFEYRADLPLGNPDIGLLLNREGSPRVENPSLYVAYRTTYADDVRRWAAEPGISINPNFVLALFAKESGFDPRATSAVPANGVAQMTPIADADLLRIARDDPRWQWLQTEARSWPRHPLIHDVRASKPRTDSLVAAGVVHAGNEYFFNPGTETRAAMIWLRMLADVWRGVGLDQAPATTARTRLNDGVALSDGQVLDLVTVSYNQGYP
jgi:hypothetical protein